MERRFRITVDGRPFTVTVEVLGEENSRLYPVPGSMSVPPAQATPPSAGEPSKATRPVAPAGEGAVVATLGGVVVEVAVAIGQNVAAGDRVAVIEAMKMKTPMVAQRAGTVAAIHVKAGEGVEPGQPLVDLA